MGFEYFILFIFLLVVFIIVLLIPVFSTFFVYQQNYQEKVSQYECGFEAVEKDLAQFEIRYYLLAILFLIFDLEIAFILPYLVVFPSLTGFGMFSMVIFFLLLLCGFFYEWLRGGLE